MWDAPRPLQIPCGNFRSQQSLFSLLNVHMENRTRIPISTINAILGELDTNGDVETLRNCALLSRSLLQPARKRLFATITIGREYLGKRLHALVLKDPHLLTYFRTLDIAADVRWYPKNNPLQDLLHVVADKAALRSISIHAPGICWSRLPPIFQQALSKVLESPSLHTVRIINICASFPLENLGMSPRLRHLAFSYKDEIQRGECKDRATPSAESPRVTTSPPVVEIPLESLQLGRIVPNQLLKYLTTRCKSDVSQLRELYVDSLEAETVKAASQVLQQSKDTLESLIWINASYESGNCTFCHLPLIIPTD